MVLFDLFWFLPGRFTIFLCARQKVMQPFLFFQDSFPLLCEHECKPLWTLRKNILGHIKKHDGSKNSWGREY